MRQELLRFRGRFLESTPCDIYQYSVLFCWRMHLGKSPSVSFAHAGLYHHSCEKEEKFTYHVF